MCGDTSVPTRGETQTLPLLFCFFSLAPGRRSWVQLRDWLDYPVIPFCTCRAPSTATPQHFCLGVKKVTAPQCAILVPRTKLSLGFLFCGDCTGPTAGLQAGKLIPLLTSATTLFSLPACWGRIPCAGDNQALTRETSSEQPQASWAETGAGDPWDHLTTHPDVWWDVIATEYLIILICFKSIAKSTLKLP